MAIIKKYNNEEKVIANKSIIDHSQLSNRDAYGSHPISAIRKLPEKLTDLKEKDKDLQTQIEHLDKVKLEQVHSNSNQFTGVGTEENPLNLKVVPDDITLKIENDKYVVKGLQDGEGSYTAQNIHNDFDDVNAKITEVKTDEAQHYQELIEKDSQQDAELKKHKDKIYDLDARTKGIGGYLNAYNFQKATPTQDELTAYALQQITGISDKTEIFNQTKVKNLFDNNIWVLTNTQDSEPPVFEWANVGTEYVNVATNDGTQGIVTGSYEELEGFIDINGHITINGLEEKFNEADNKLNSEIQRLTEKDAELETKITDLSQKSASETELGLIKMWKDSDGNWNLSN